MYCQRDIEDQSICETQCEHCKAYYEPLEIDAAALDYAESGEGLMNILPYDDDEGINRDIKAFKAGALFYKNYIKP